MTLYDNLGGECLGRLVDSFYEQVLADPVLSLHYQDYDLAKVNKGQRTFLKMAFGGPKDYKGRDLKTVHANMKITQAEFDQAWRYMEAALEHAKVKKELWSQVKGIFYSFQDKVVTVP